MEHMDLDTVLKRLNLIFLLAIGVLVKWIREWRLENKRMAEQKATIDYAQQMAILSLLRDRILQSGAYFVRLGAIPSRVQKSLLQMGEAYFLLLGYNDECHEMIDHIKGLPVDDNILYKTEYRSPDNE